MDALPLDPHPTFCPPDSLALWLCVRTLCSSSARWASSSSFSSRCDCGYIVSLVRATGRNAPLIRFVISALYILFAWLYRKLPHLFLFLRFFVTFIHLLPLRIDVLRFQAGCRKRRPNIALVLCVFILCFITFLLIVLVLVFCPYEAKRLSRGNVSEMTYFVRSGT